MKSVWFQMRCTGCRLSVLWFAFSTIPIVRKWERGKKQRYRYDYNDKKGKAFEQYDGDSGDYEEKIDGNAKETIGKNLDFTVGGDVTFKVGASTVKVCQSGTIEITGTTVKITGATVNISGGSGDCKINGVSLVNHKHEHDGSAKAGPYTVSGNTGVPVK